MAKKSHQAPEVDKVYTIDDAIAMKKSTDEWDIWKVQYLVTKAAEDDIYRVFADWIDEDIKRRMDVADLTCIKEDIDMYDNYGDFDNVPELSWYTFELAEIDMFINSTEEKIGRRLNYDDFLGVPWLCDSIDMIQPIRINKNTVDKEKKLKNIWFRKVITNIRNGLMHNRYILNAHGVYIHSDEGLWNQPFEAFVSYDFFNKIITFCEESDRKIKLLGLKTDNNVDWWKWFDKNKDLIFIETRDAVWKWDIYTSEIEKLFAAQSAKKQFRKLSEWQKEFFSEYFKTHEFNRRNLAFLSRILWNSWNWIQIQTISQIDENLTLKARDSLLNWVNNNGLLKWIMLQFTQWDNIAEWKIWNTDKYIKKEIESLLISEKVLPYMVYYYYKNSESKRYLSDITPRPLAELLPVKIKNSIISIIKYYKEDLLAIKDFYSISKKTLRKPYLQSLYLSKFYVNNPKLKLAQPQKRVWDGLRRQWYNYIMNRLKSNSSELYRNVESKRAWIDIILWKDKIHNTSYREYIFKQLSLWRTCDDWIIKNTNDVNQIMSKINLYGVSATNNLDNNQKLILKDNVSKVITERKEKLDTVTIIWEEEHIRNAFAHHHYTIIPWFNKILLWDPSIDDTPNWEWVYDLDELYQNAVGRVSEDYLDIKTAS